MSVRKVLEQRNLDLSQLLTIVIPTWSGGRPKLKALLTHWSSVGCRLRIIDGSDERWDPGDLYARCNPGLVEYLHLPVMENGVYENLQLRMFQGFEDISTPFVACCGDDDVYTQSGLRNAVQVLLNEPSLDTVVGRAIMVCPDNYGDLRWKHVHAEWRDSDVWRSPNPLERIVTGDGIGYYSIGRSDFIGQLFKFVFKFPNTFPYLNEYLIKYLIQLAANLRVIDSLTWLRGPENFQPLLAKHNHLNMFSDLQLGPENLDLATKRLAEGIQLLRQDISEADALLAASKLLRLHESEHILQQDTVCQEEPALLTRFLVAGLRRTEDFPDWLRYRIYQFLDWFTLNTKRGNLVFLLDMSYQINKVIANLDGVSIEFDDHELQKLDATYREVLNAC